MGCDKKKLHSKHTNPHFNLGFPVTHARLIEMPGTYVDVSYQSGSSLAQHKVNGCDISFFTTFSCNFLCFI